MRKYLLFLLLLTACHKTPLKRTERIYPVTIKVAEKKKVPLFIETLGHVESITNINIKSRIEGELTGVHFSQGKEVLKGDLLFTIDSKPYEATLKASLATLEQNMASQALALEKVKRYRLLAKEEFYSQIDYETLQANLASANALVDQSKAQVDSARINLDYCRIYAPIDGMMGILQIDYGNLIANNGATLASLSQMSPIYTTFSIPEFQLHRVQKALKKNSSLEVRAASEDFEEESTLGTLFAIDNSVNADTGMIRLRAVFENEKRDLWPGQFVRVRLVLSEEEAVVIPFTAVQHTQNGPVLFLLKEGNVVEQKSITLGQRDNDEVIVLKGLEAGEKIVLEGQLNLYSGAKVTIQ
jgi:membrane fusion protein, multidrug efflux system